MNVPMRWLSEVIDTGLTAEELAHRLTMAGLEAEKVEQVPAGWEDVYVGLVTHVEKHPDADRLNLVDVAAGEYGLRVVTGAPNIAEGQKVALALAGARLIDPYTDSPTPVYKTLKPGKIRGIVSEGMVCSERELGISDEHEGILVLEPEAPEGMPLRDWLGDTVIEFEITPNLVHAFSMLGIARQAAPLTGAEVHIPPVADLDALPQRDDLVAIRNPELCQQLSGAVIEDVRVGPSPLWMQRRLGHAGVRPVNNLVDVTNYVMLEFGQPLHAYDRDRLAGGRIIARRAAAGEGIETLDHQWRTLSDDLLVIADDDRAVGVAGVMGGVDSEVSDDTTTILLEAATFDMKAIRRARQALRLRSDASARFERGLDPNLARPAIARAITLIRDMCPEARVTGFQQAYPEPVRPWQVEVPVSLFARVLGVAIPEEQIRSSLDALGLAPRISGDGEHRTLVVTVPTERQDLRIPVDIVEEVARVIGYDVLPDTLILGRTPPVARDLFVAFQRRIARRLASVGASEAVSYPTIGAPDLDALEGGSVDDATAVGFLDRRPAGSLVRLVNPIQAERPYLRNTLVPSLLGVAAANRKHEPGVALFEVGRTFRPVAGLELPDEITMMALVVAGARRPLNRFAPVGEADYFDGKGRIDAALAGERFAVTPAWRRMADPLPFLHPGRVAELVLDERVVGILGELRPDVAQAFGLEERVTVGEMDLVALYAARSSTDTGVRVPRFLPAQQDFAVIVSDDVPAADVRAALAVGAGPLATDILLFDLFAGPQLGEGKKSLAWRVTFEAPDRALTDAELVKTRGRIEKVLKQRVNGVLRGE